MVSCSCSFYSLSVPGDKLRYFLALLALVIGLPGIAFACSSSSGWCAYIRYYHRYHSCDDNAACESESSSLYYTEQLYSNFGFPFSWIDYPLSTYSACEENTLECVEERYAEREYFCMGIGACENQAQDLYEEELELVEEDSSDDDPEDPEDPDAPGDGFGGG